MKRDRSGLAGSSPHNGHDKADKGPVRGILEGSHVTRVAVVDGHKVAGSVDAELYLIVGHGHREPRLVRNPKRDVGQVFPVRGQRGAIWRQHQLRGAAGGLYAVTG